VVAAVFSYVMLGAGFFTTQKSQETVYSAIGQAGTNMEVSGPVILETNTDSQVKSVAFTLILAAGGMPVDMKKVTYTVSTQTSIDDLTLNDAAVSMSKHNANENDLLERGEIAEITITGSSVGNIKANLPFTIEVKPSTGAALPITRFAPLSFGKNAFYEVY